MKHTEDPFMHSTRYRGARCSCGFIANTGGYHADVNSLIAHMKSAEAQDDKDTIKMLTERLHERTQGMLAKQVEMLNEIRRLNRILGIKDRSKQNPYAGL